MFKLTSFALLLLTLLPSCGGGGSSSSSPSLGLSNLDVLVTDAPANELLAFQATVIELHLVLQGGGETPNLLAGPISLELLSLQGTSAWLASQNLPAGTYSGVHLVFQHGSYAARRNDGSSVAVISSSDDLSISFGLPFGLDDSSYRRVLVDIDLLNALTGSLSAPPLLFSPMGLLTDDSGHVESSIDEVKGIVQSVDAAQNSLVLSAFVDDDAQVALGDVQVIVGPTTLLVQDGGTPFASSADFFASLTAGLTFLEVHGNLLNGAVQATRIEVDDNSGGGGSANLVRLKGLVNSIGPGSEFGVAISSVPQGSSIVAAAFGGVLPATLDVSFDDTTHFYLHEHQTSTSASLALGQKVDVKFSTFANAPYLAARVEIDDESGENEGTVTNASGLPDSFVMHLDESSAALFSGQVASTSTNVNVTLTGAPITLETPGNPALTASQILQGLRVDVHGPVSGTPSAPSIAASALKVRPGKLKDAIINSATGGGSPSFTTFGGSIDDPFGSNVTEGPLTIQLAPGCVFQGAATSEASFLALAMNPPGGAVVRVRVRGIGSGSPDEIRAYLVESDLNH